MDPACSARGRRNRRPNSDTVEFISAKARVLGSAQDQKATRLPSLPALPRKPRHAHQTTGFSPASAVGPRVYAIVRRAKAATSHHRARRGRASTLILSATAFYRPFSMPRRGQGSCPPRRARPVRRIKTLSDSDLYCDVPALISMWSPIRGLPGTKKSEPLHLETAATRFRMDSAAASLRNRMSYSEGRLSDGQLKAIPSSWAEFWNVK